MIYNFRDSPRISFKANAQVVEKPSFAGTMLNMEVGYTSEEFTSAFETRGNTAKYYHLPRVSTAAGGGWPTVVY